MKKLLFILILFYSISSFAQKRVIVRVPQSARHITWMAKNRTNDSTYFWIGSQKFAIADKDSITAQIAYTFSTGLTNTANTITNDLLTGIAGGQTIIGSTSTNSGLILKPTTSGTAGVGADIKFLVGNNGAIDAGRINHLGKWGINNTAPANYLNVNTPTTADVNADIIFGSSGTTKKPVVIQGLLNQTANILEFQNSTGAIQGAFGATGNLGIGLSNTTTHAILINRSDLTGGSANSPSIKVSNTNASSPGGGQYNYGMIQVLAGNEAVAGQFFANYGTGATAPFNFGSSVMLRSNGAYPIVLSPNNTPYLVVSSAGAVRFNSYGAGTATFDASGNITSVSDERLKTSIRPYKTGLKELMNINPITYKWTKKSGNETSGTYAGFSAQNVKANIPLGTGENDKGYLSLQDRAIIATLVNAVKEQQQQIEDLKKEIKKLK